ncbi:antifreeze protein [Mycena metata]|uniref:Antifreeze protein n=1 Tax=Mycena metata TaxID=1033252 RepID=A0AAD7K3H3_9AGAR|nr:antifreeze protein [Mycena metata]
MLSNTFIPAFLTLLGGAAALGPAAVNLGTAGNYTILAETGITTVPPSVITGPIAVSPIGAAAMTGWSQTLDSSGKFSTSTQVTGDLFAADYANPTPPTLTIAIADMGTAYGDATGRTSPNFTNLGSGLIGGLTLTPGLYNWATAVSIGSDITISGAATDTWIFQVTGTLTVGSAVRMTLSGGARAANIVWVVTDSITAGSTSHLEGVFLGKTSITLDTGSTANSRLLAQTLVALQSATVTAPS